MGALSLFLQACPAAPCRGKLPHSVASSSPSRRRAVIVRALNQDEVERVEHGSCGVGENVARVVRMGLVFAAFSVAGAHRAFTGQAVAAPAAAAATQSEIVEEENAILLGLSQEVLETYSLDERFKSFTASLPEREKTYRQAFAVDEILRELKSSGKQDIDEQLTRLQELVGKGLQRLKLETGRLQSRVVLETRSYVAKLKKEEQVCCQLLEKATENFPGVKEMLEGKRARTPEMEAQFQLYASRTGDIRTELMRIKGNIIGCEYEGWVKAWKEIPYYAAKCEAEILEAARFLDRRVQAPAESQIANDLRTTGERLWGENVLPLAVNPHEQDTVVVQIGRKTQSDMDTLLRNHMQFADKETANVLPAMTKSFGSLELAAAMGEIPSEEDLRKMVGWKKWCSIKREDLKQRLLEDSEYSRSYIQEKQEKLLQARDKVLEGTWYKEKFKRWEMSPKAALYAVDRDLVHHVRLRHDGRVLFLALKGDDQEYAVNCKAIRAYLADKHGLDGLYATLRMRGIPTVVEKMEIPVREWSPFELVSFPFVALWKKLVSLVTSDVFFAFADIYLGLLENLAKLFMVRIGYPVIKRFPRQVRAFLGYDLPVGSEFTEATFLMKWQEEAEKEVREDKANLPWFIDLPIRTYIHGGPLFLVAMYVFRILGFILSPLSLPPVMDKKVEKKPDKKSKRYEDKVAKNPMKVVFDKIQRVRRPKVPLKDFVGIEGCMEEIIEVVNFLRDPAAYKKLGARPPRGVLIVGEHGMGKTLLAQAIASEARVPIVEPNVFEMRGGGDWVGQKAANVRDLFKAARQYAPVIVFMPNFDTFVGKRGEVAHEDAQEVESVINQYLVELDGFETQDGVVLMATTSVPDKIDEALRRPGRMDRTITLPLPNRSQREQILRRASKRTMEPYLRDWMNWPEVAAQTAGYTYEDLEFVPRSLELGAFQLKDIHPREFMPYAKVLTLLPSWLYNLPPAAHLRYKLYDFLGILVTKKDMEMTVKYMALQRHEKPDPSQPISSWTREFKYPHAVWAAGRGLVGLLLPNYDILQLMTLDRFSGEGIGWTKFKVRVPEGFLETNTMTRSYLEKKLVALHGGEMALEMMRGRAQDSDVLSDDPAMARATAESMVLEYGWSSDDSPMVYRSEDREMKTGRDESEALRRKTEELCALARSRARQMLEQNRHVLEAMVEELLKHNFMTQEDMEMILRDRVPIYEQDPFMLQKVDKVHESTNGSSYVTVSPAASFA